MRQYGRMTRFVVRAHRNGWIVYDTQRDKPYDVRPIAKVRAQALADAMNAQMERVRRGYGKRGTE